jgi:anionic cell wall polymer biosynthesis LytR-Cps2A-Psr (LCP) family protein
MMPPSSTSQRRRTRWPIVFVIAALILLAAGLAALSAVLLSPRIPINPSDAPLTSLDLPTIGTWQGREGINVLLIGIDQRTGEPPAAARSDALMLLTLDPVARSAGLLSIPHDPLPTSTAGQPM